MPSVYADPIYSHRLATGTGAGAVIDIGTADYAGYPPVLICVVPEGATITYLVEGSHDGIAFVDFSGGGFTDSVAKDLIPGVRFWRTNIVSSDGAFTSSVGAVPTQAGGVRMPNLYIQATTTTANPTV